MNSGTFKSGLASINNHYRKHTYTVIRPMFPLPVFQQAP